VLWAATSPSSSSPSKSSSFTVLEAGNGGVGGRGGAASRSASTSPSRRAAQLSSSLRDTRCDGDEASPSPSPSSSSSSYSSSGSPLVVGSECEVWISDEDMVRVGLLPSLVDLKVPTAGVVVVVNGDGGGASAAAVDSQSLPPPPPPSSSLSPESSSSSEALTVRPLSEPEAAAAAAVVDAPAPRTYTTHWVEAVVITAHPDGTVDLFLPSAVHTRFLRPVLSRQPRTKLRPRTLAVAGAGDGRLST
jgi:hypothetical protein